MLTIRLRRKGKKNQPFFRVIVIDKRKTAKGGNAVEIVGSIDPLTKKKHFKKDRVLYWISKGAKPSASVHNLLVSEKIIDDKKINVSKKSKKLPKSPEATGIPAAEGSLGTATVAPVATTEAQATEAPAPATETPVQPVPAEIKAEENPAEAPKEEPKPVEEKKEEPKDPEIKLEEAKLTEEKTETPEEKKEPVTAKEPNQAKEESNA